MKFCSETTLCEKDQQPHIPSLIDNQKSIGQSESSITSATLDQLTGIKSFNFNEEKLWIQNEIDQEISLIVSPLISMVTSPISQNYLNLSRKLFSNDHFDDFECSSDTITECFDQSQSCLDSSQSIYQRNKQKQYQIGNQIRAQSKQIHKKISNLQSNRMSDQQKIDEINLNERFQSFRNRRRHRKLQAHIKILNEEYSKNPYWARNKILEISKITSLKPSQIYKWNWDRRIFKNQQVIRELIAQKRYFGKLFDVQKSSHTFSEGSLNIFKVERDCLCHHNKI
ncbi:UNKNOWN [Stylonychia lemnae]|uniref:Homeobox domain-containing protein n=1 Tax=Stylonychia lemnae TaxID=5949 RepID=A0A078A2Z4_STYLE|nr:UNKNOWN [Stylonychia lemnae]|eukprot:CDW76500.1 UNKNOWN [Stylonychia lemnae]